METKTGPTLNELRKEQRSSVGSFGCEWGLHVEHYANSEYLFYFWNGVKQMVSSLFVVLQIQEKSMKIMGLYIKTVNKP